MLKKIKSVYKTLRLKILGHILLKYFINEVRYITMRQYYVSFMWINPNKIGYMPEQPQYGDKFINIDGGKAINEVAIKNIKKSLKNQYSNLINQDAQIIILNIIDITDNESTTKNLVKTEEEQAKYDEYLKTLASGIQETVNGRVLNEEEKLKTLKGDD